MADDIDHGAFELFIEGGFVLPVDGAVMGGRDQLLRARQAPNVGRQNPVSHMLLLTVTSVASSAGRGDAPPVAIFIKLTKSACPRQDGDTESPANAGKQWC
jgi:hypothetical protein